MLGSVMVHGDSIVQIAEQRRGGISATVESHCMKALKKTSGKVTGIIGTSL